MTNFYDDTSLENLDTLEDKMVPLLSDYDDRELEKKQLAEKHQSLLMEASKCIQQCEDEYKKIRLDMERLIKNNSSSGRLFSQNSSFDQYVITLSAVKKRLGKVEDILQDLKLWRNRSENFPQDMTNRYWLKDSIDNCQSFFAPVSSDKELCANCAACSEAERLTAPSPHKSSPAT